MANSATLKSVRDSTRLTFSDFSGDSFTAALTSSHFSAQIIISTYYSGDPSILFDEMAREWRGWKKVKSWSALEDELHLTASSDLLGHVELVVVMRDYIGPANWRLEAALHFEAGQLEDLANKVKSAFGERPR